MLAENGELSFGDSGRMMGELWHKLSDDQKEDYRKRAKDVTDQKLKDWQVMTYLNTSIQELAENTELDTLWLTPGNSQIKALIATLGIASETTDLSGCFQVAFSKIGAPTLS